MKKTNYIVHLNAFYTRIYEDDRLNPSHITIYMALFQFWNQNRFVNPFRVARSEVMKLSKIRSTSTYRKCIRELHNWDYLVYTPSHNPFKGSQFKMVNIWSSRWPMNELPLPGTWPISEPPFTDTPPINERAVSPSKTYKPKVENVKGRPYKENEVINYFLIQYGSRLDAQKFWNHYESNGWKSGGKVPLENWQAAARKWILNSKYSTKSQPNQSSNNLHTSPKKNYNEPL